MKSTIYKLILFVLFTAFISWIRCSVDPLSPQALEGGWVMLTFTDKETNVTFDRDKPTDIGNGVTQTMSGDLWFYLGDENNIGLSIFTKTIIPDEEEQVGEKAIYGEYTIEASTLTIIEAITGETRTFNISRSGLRLTLEDGDGQSTWGTLD
ncbi:hypothetical protein IIA28_21310 [candidate division KSB1 bacterium]|nr:hypothetical protein [candidate division KSB1 bacterium]